MHLLFKGHLGVSCLWQLFIPHFFWSKSLEGRCGNNNASPGTRVVHPNFAKEKHLSQTFLIVIYVDFQGCKYEFQWENNISYVVTTRTWFHLFWRPRNNNIPVGCQYAETNWLPASSDTEKHSQSWIICVHTGTCIICIHVVQHP